jgi:hypothetical protein
MGSATGVARRESRGSSVWPSYALGTAVSLIASLIVPPVLLRMLRASTPPHRVPRSKPRRPLDDDAARTMA